MGFSLQWYTYHVPILVSKLTVTPGPLSGFIHSASMFCWLWIPLYTVKKNNRKVIRGYTRKSCLIYEEKGCNSRHIMRKLFPSHMTVSVHTVLQFFSSSFADFSKRVLETPLSAMLSVHVSEWLGLISAATPTNGVRHGGRQQHRRPHSSSAYNLTWTKKNVLDCQFFYAIEKNRRGRPTLTLL
jgi:hypothetical protein